MNFSYSRQAGFLGLTLFILGLGLNLTWQFLPVYFEGVLESAFLVGLLVSLPSLANLFLDIPVGNYIQRSGERVTYAIGLFVYALPPLFFLISAPAAFFAGKLAEGVGKSFLWTSGWSLTLRSSSDGSDSESASVFLLGEYIASVVGPILGGVLIAMYGFEPLFLAWFVLGMVAVAVFAWRSDSDLSKLENPRFLTSRETYRADVEDLRPHWGRLKYVFSIIFFYSVVFSFYWYAIPLALDDLNASFIQMGLVFGLAMVPALFQFGFGYVADKIGHRKTLIGLSIPLSLVLLSMGLADSLLTLSLLYLVAALLSHGIDPAIHAVFDLNVPDEEEPEITGFFEFSKHSGQFIGPAAAGAITSVFSISASFIFASLGAAMIAFTTLLSKRGKMKA